ncbi:hypothetical protein [Myxococcus sp. CA051A]|nr:hypothetical protein [Myxococcus sp. CA051A]
METLDAKSLEVSAYWLRTPHPAALQRRAREAAHWREGSCT